jgi:hypothetical protein
MALNNRFHKVTQGVNYELIIADSLITASGTTLNAFTAAGPLYRMGIFKEEAIAAQPVSLAIGGSVIPTADQKKNILFAYTIEADANGVFQVRHTTSCRANTCRAEVFAYKAPTMQCSTMALASGTPNTGHRIAMKVIETTPMNLPMPTWDFDELMTLGHTVTIGKFVTKINKALEGEFFNAAFATAAMVSPVVGTVSISGGITGVALTTAGSNIYTIYNGRIPITFTGGTGSGGAAYLPIVNGIALTPVITAAGAYTVAPTASLPTLTALQGASPIPTFIVWSNDADRHFRIVCTNFPTKAIPAEPDTVYTYTVAQAQFSGQGTLAQIRELQLEDSIRRGISHFQEQTPMVSPSDFGLPKDAIGTTTTFDVVAITIDQRESSPTPGGERTNKKFIYIAVPVGSGTNIAALFAY